MEVLLYIFAGIGMISAMGIIGMLLCIAFSSVLETEEVTEETEEQENEDNKQDREVERTPMCVFTNEHCMYVGGRAYCEGCPICEQAKANYLQDQRRKRR